MGTYFAQGVVSPLFRWARPMNQAVAWYLAGVCNSIPGSRAPHTECHKVCILVCPVHIVILLGSNYPVAIH